MKQQDKKKYNLENEHNYYYAPFSEARAELRKVWGTTRKNWESFLYDQEKKYQLLNK
jgi:hypothetical protein